MSVSQRELNRLLQSQANLPFAGGEPSSPRATRYANRQTNTPVPSTPGASRDEHESSSVGSGETVTVGFNSQQPATNSAQINSRQQSSAPSTQLTRLESQPPEPISSSQSPETVVEAGPSRIGGNGGPGRFTGAVQGNSRSETNSGNASRGASEAVDGAHANQPQGGRPQNEENRQESPRSRQPHEIPSPVSEGDMTDDERQRHRMQQLEIAGWVNGDFVDYPPGTIQRLNMLGVIRPATRRQILDMQEPTCYICNCAYGVSDVGGVVEYPVLLSCGHLFGQKCLIEWFLTQFSLTEMNPHGLLIHTTCPTCRRSLLHMENEKLRALGEDMGEVGVVRMRELLEFRDANQERRSRQRAFIDLAMEAGAREGVQDWDDLRAQATRTMVQASNNTPGPSITSEDRPGGNGSASGRTNEPSDGDSMSVDQQRQPSQDQPPPASDGRADREHRQGRRPDLSVNIQRPNGGSDGDRMSVDQRFQHQQGFLGPNSHSGRSNSNGQSGRSDGDRMSVDQQRQHGQGPRQSFGQPNRFQEQNRNHGQRREPDPNFRSGVSREQDRNQGLFGAQREPDRGFGNGRFRGPDRPQGQHGAWIQPNEGRNTQRVNFPQDQYFEIDYGGEEPRWRLDYLQVRQVEERAIWPYGYIVSEERSPSRQKRYIYKQVVGVFPLDRRGRSFHLLVRYPSNEPNLYCYDLEPSSKFPGKMEEFRDSEPFTSMGQRSDIDDLDYSELRICGVASVKQNLRESENINTRERTRDVPNQTAKTRLLVESETFYLWFFRSDLTSTYGERRVDNDIARFRERTGQYSQRHPPGVLRDIRPRYQETIAIGTDDSRARGRVHWHDAADPERNYFYRDRSYTNEGNRTPREADAEIRWQYSEPPAGDGQRGQATQQGRRFEGATQTGSVRENQREGRRGDWGREPERRETDREIESLRQQVTILLGRLAIMEQREDRRNRGQAPSEETL